MRLDLRPGAQAEVEDAAAWYDRERRGLGLEFIAALDHAFDDLLSSAENNPIWTAGAGPTEDSCCEDFLT